MKKLLIAALLAGIALAGPAYGATVVANAADCPAGTVPGTAAYEWHDGHFVRVGWTCESLYDPMP